MKKLILILLLSSGLIGCSAIDYSELSSPVSPSDTQIERIISLGLSHSDSLLEANKLMDPDLVAIVVKELENRKVKADEAQIEEGIVAEYAEKIIILENNSKFIGPEINERRKVGLMLESDYEDYYLKGQKDLGNGSISHQLYLSLKYNADKLRNYNSANFCDKWQDCSSGKKIVVANIQSGADSCSGSNCEYREIFELEFTDEVLKSYMNDGLSFVITSKRNSNKITIPANYIKGYLRVSN
tara:strand:+ start:70 stop:795 length:726 start_codon:yes stop_codon:yes gene_type:complete